jgi:hypothetical protein
MDQELMFAMVANATVQVTTAIKTNEAIAAAQFAA